MTYIVCDPCYSQHQTTPGHPECPDRYHAIMKALEANALLSKVLPPRKASEEEVALCHPLPYIRQVAAHVQSIDRVVSFPGDVDLCPQSYEVALFAVGGVLAAVDAVMNKVAKNVFCVVRPPGHHACRETVMGFCVFNNVAIGARYVQKQYGIERVLIVDWDVHHGNGTEDIFSDDPSVYYFSTHERGNYPGTGNRGEGNVPIARGAGSALKVLAAFKEKLVPAMEIFKPQFVLISAGFDGHKDDPLGRFDLVEKDFAELTCIVKKIADRYAGGRLVSVLEGGYNLEALAASVAAHVKSLTLSKK